MFEEIPSRLEQALQISKQFQEARFLEVVFYKLGELRNFSRPNPRYDDVHEAALNTCEWILKEPKKLLEVEEKPKLTFTEWLLEGSGVFHVAGKPGSGKSTLMKYICEHDEVRQHLQQWAQPSKLIFTQYFFWRPDDLQNGFRGLRRCLLRAAMGQAPELCKTLPIPQARISIDGAPANEGHRSSAIKRSLWPLRLRGNTLGRRTPYVFSC